MNMLISGNPIAGRRVISPAVAVCRLCEDDCDARHWSLVGYCLKASQVVLGSTGASVHLVATKVTAAEMAELVEIKKGSRHLHFSAVHGSCGCTQTLVNPLFDQRVNAVRERAHIERDIGEQSNVCFLCANETRIDVPVSERSYHGHHSLLMSCSFTIQVLAQFDLMKFWNESTSLQARGLLLAESTPQESEVITPTCPHGGAQRL